MPAIPPILDELVTQTLQSVAARSRPESTYRLQFNPSFTFRDATAIAPYLAELGITHCYASPYLRARSGSQHGYDITDHNLLNPEIGSPDDYNAWIDSLQQNGLAQVLDIVPNHMAVIGNENVWWNDVLENGPASPFAPFFDIEWQSPRPELQGRVLVPVLGEPYHKVLEGQQLRLSYAAGLFTINYFDHRFPVSPHSYRLILNHRVELLAERLGAESPALLEYQSVLTALKNLADINETDPEKLAERGREKEVIKRRLASVTAQNPLVVKFIEETLAEFNGKPHDPDSFNLMEQLLDQQAYRLAFWRVATDEINYRRFFDVNELAALSMERLEVFQASHNLVLRLLAEGKIDGVRVDHVDGLFDPRQYLERLQLYFLLGVARKLFAERTDTTGTDWNELAGPVEDQFRQILSAGCFKRDRTEATNGQAADSVDGASAKVRSTQPAEAVSTERRPAGFLGEPENRAETIAPVGQVELPARELLADWPLYVIVEKILARGEHLRIDWPTHGTSGYLFLNMANGLFIDDRNADAFTRLYREYSQVDTPFAEVGYESKRLILGIALASELNMLSLQLDRLAQRNRWSRDFTLNTLRQGLREFIAGFPVYRSYITGLPIDPADHQQVRKAMRRALVRNPALSRAVFTFVQDTLLLRASRPVSEEYQEEQRRFVGKFQQVTSPVMAKGVEDTAFYIYNRLVSLNEVGSEPTRFGISTTSLHEFFQERQAEWPHGFSTLSTHDTKRSADVRARINVLSELPLAWSDAVNRWTRLNESHRISIEDETVPDPNEEYLLYQTLVGAWPIEPVGAEEYARFVERIKAYMQKVLHEAKVHSSWISPNEDYDAAMQQFIERILDPAKSPAFLEDFRSFAQRINHYGLLNSLAQVLLQLTAPGVADIYQGSELWDFSLVDPDNRRPVDYEQRQNRMRELGGRVEEAGGDFRELAAALTGSMNDGRIKLYLTWRGLNCRREHPGLFTVGEYLPVETAGTRAEHVFSFVRRNDKDCALIAVPRLLTRLLPSMEQQAYGPAVWGDTVLRLPAGATGRWRNVFTGELLEAKGDGGSLPMSEVCGNFPVALLLREYAGEPRA
jgi:(1->4)-alpha-D-glucan 1-alpha-D-glucosylmutase